MYVMLFLWALDTKTNRVKDIEVATRVGKRLLEIMGMDNLLFEDGLRLKQVFV